MDVDVFVTASVRSLTEVVASVLPSPIAYQSKGKFTHRVVTERPFESLLLPPREMVHVAGGLRGSADVMPLPKSVDPADTDVRFCALHQTWTLVYP